MNKKKVLLFLPYYIPSQNSGGPLTSIRNLTNELYDYFDFHIITSDREFGSNVLFDLPSHEWIEVEKSIVKYVDYSNDLRNNNVIREIIESEYDLFWFSSLFDSFKKYKLLKRLIKHKKKILISPRGELSEKALKMKRFKKMAFFIFSRVFSVYKNVFFHVTASSEITGLKKHLNIRDEFIFFASNIPTKFNSIEHNYKDKDYLKIVFLSRIHPKKNLMFALEVLSKVKGNYIFDIYGPIEDNKYWEEILKFVTLHRLEKNVIYKSSIAPNMIDKTLKNYECFFFPTLGENYGHVISEALKCKCIVVLSKNTTPWDDMDSTLPFVHDLSDINSFVSSIEHLISIDNNEYLEYQKKIDAYLIHKESSNNSVGSHKKMLLRLTRGENEKNILD
ncbi:MAG: glycosyltransferase [Bacilli bacterium]|nr:glycosyltransferase [Bacilli bacterium]